MVTLCCICWKCTCAERRASSGGRAGSSFANRYRTFLFARAGKGPRGGKITPPPIASRKRFVKGAQCRGFERYTSSRKMLLRAADCPADLSRYLHKDYSYQSTSSLRRRKAPAFRHGDEDRGALPRRTLPAFPLFTGTNRMSE